MRPSIIRKINPRDPEPEITAEAAAIIKKEGVVVFPTRCLYGLAADAMNPVAVERIFEIKHRPQHNPILVLIDSRSQLEMLVEKIPPAADAMMTAFWPGRVTLVLEARNSLPVRLTAQTGKIGVRLAGHPVAAALIQQSGCPITGTSANRSGNPGCYRLSELDPSVAGQVDLILDAGELRGGVGSTVVDVTGQKPRILREGEVGAAEILRALDRLCKPS
jgi:L-threonylcarbamoyladenylate synthase